MKEWFRRRRLPHWDKPGAVYFVTSCLDGSIPARGLLDIDGYRDSLEKKRLPKELTHRQWENQKWKLVFGRTDDWLDGEPVACHLEDERLASVVEQSLLHFAGERYAIWAWVVMPSHFHWIFEPLKSWVDRLGTGADQRTPRERIMHGAKRYSARQCNNLRNRTGAFWQDESYDHCIEDVDELERVIDYVELNPAKAGMVQTREEFRFSSAWYRREHGIAAGRPLIGETLL